MLVPILTTIGIFALVGWLTFLAVRHLLPRVPNPALVRQAARDRVVADPLDFVRAWVMRVAPAQLRLQQRREAAQARVSAADERQGHLLTAFPDGKEPGFGFRITAIILFALWIVSIVAAFLIDVPIINAVSGGNPLFGVVGTVLILAIPVIGSVLLGHFVGKWRAGEMSMGWFSLATTAILAAVVAVVAILIALAPIRAEVEYADKIRMAEQQRTMYAEDGDENAVQFAEQNIADLEAQQARSTEWNRALVPIAAGAEFATGFFVPLAIPLLLLGSAKKARRKAETDLTRSDNAVRGQRARQYARLSATFQRLGLTQLSFQQHLATVHAENTRDAATPLEAARADVAQQLLDQVPHPQDAAQDEAITAEIVTTDEVPTVAPKPPRPPRATPPRPHRRPADADVASAPTPAAQPDPDLPDESFDLS